MCLPQSSLDIGNVTEDTINVTRLCTDIYRPDAWLQHLKMSLPDLPPQLCSFSLSLSRSLSLPPTHCHPPSFLSCAPDSWVPRSRKKRALQRKTMQGLPQKGQVRMYACLRITLGLCDICIYTYIHMSLFIYIHTYTHKYIS